MAQYIGCRSIPFQHLCLLLRGEYALPFIRAATLSEGRSEDTLPEVNKSPDSPYGSVAHTSHGNGGSAHTPLHDRQRYFHYISRHPIYTSRRNESPARPHHRPTHHLRIGLPPHPAETSSSDLANNPHTFHVLIFHAMRLYYIRCKHLMRTYSQKEVALLSTATAVLSRATPFCPMFRKGIAYQSASHPFRVVAWHCVLYANPPFRFTP